MSVHEDLRYRKRSWRSRVSRIKALYVSVLLCVACRHATSHSDELATCTPAKGAQSLLLHLEAGKNLNRDRRGESLPTRVTIFQLTASTGDRVGNATVKLPGEDTILTQHELTIYPAQSIEVHLERATDATHVAVAAELREPLGVGWLDEVRLPSRAPCDAQIEGIIRLAGARVTMDLKTLQGRGADVS